MNDQNIYQLPLWFDYVATFLWAISGAFFGARRGFDISGIVTFAILACAGGGLLRDGLFLNDGPVALVKDPMYILIPLVMSAIVWRFGRQISRVPKFDAGLDVIDAIGTGGFALFGLQLALHAGVTIPGSLLIAVVNGVGGSILRDVLANRVPEFVQPGVLYGIAALAASIAFLLMVGPLGIPSTLAGVIGVGVMVAIRLAAEHFDLQTKPAPWVDAKGDRVVG